MELKLLLVLGAMLLLPGWAFLVTTNVWRRWPGLQSWILAVGVSVAFYPILFYATRFVFPTLSFGPYKMSAILLLCLAVIIFRLRGSWKQCLAFDDLEWGALLVFGMVLFTRLWVIRDLPYPAWADSLHHVLLTQLTARLGHLPQTLDPYFPISLSHYHLGLYALSASVEWLAQVPSHTALLWSAQVLNGLCGLGVYLVLDRHFNRRAGIFGAIVVGLFSHHPAFYVNWGRFTQIASQTIVLIAWSLFWEFACVRRSLACQSLVVWGWDSVLVAVLSGGVFLLHFRVAIYYGALVIITLLWELGRAHLRWQTMRIVLLRSFLVAVLALCIVLPALWEAVEAYVAHKFQRESALLSEAERQLSDQLYYSVPWESVLYLLARLWLLVLLALGSLVGLWKRVPIIILSILWMAALCMLGFAYILNVPLLRFTNLSGILIMFYMPLGLILGAAFEVLVLSGLLGDKFPRLLAFVILMGSFIASHLRVVEIEPYRYFVAQEDIAAMQWIDAHIPEDAVFAVNTCLAYPETLFGTDAGYWIPYFTGRGTTVGVLLNEVGPEAYFAKILAMSRAAEALETTPTAVNDLFALGVEYIYVGKMGDFSGPGLDAVALSQQSNVDVLYQKAGVAVLQIKP